MQRATLTAIFIALTLHPACSLFHRRQPPPMPTKPFDPPAERARNLAPPAELEDPPLLDPEAPPAEVALPIPVTDEAPPYQPQRAKSRRPRHIAPKGEREEENVEAANLETAPEPAPQLVQMLSPEQRKEYEQVIDQNLSQAQKSLTAVTGRTLSSEQHESVTLINSFIRQAQEAREQDPLRARSLAERASVLAQHLEKSFR